MVALNVKKDKNVFSANWEANLLVKDRLSGKLKRLRFQNYPDRLKELLEEEEKEKSERENKDEILKLSLPITEESLLKVAPAQDNFIPIRPGIILPPTAKAELHFHPDDRQQAEDIAKNLPEDDSKKYSLEKIVQALTDKQKLDLDEANKEKFSNLIFDFFRNRKRFLNVREALLTEVASRQGKLNDQTVDNVLSVVKGLKIKMEAAGGLVVRAADQAATVSPVKIFSEKPTLSPAPAITPVPEIKKEPVIKNEPDREIVQALQELDKDLPSVPTPTWTKPADTFTPPPVTAKAGFVISSPEKKPETVKPMPILPAKSQSPVTDFRVSRPVENEVSKKSITDVVSKKEVVFKAVPQVRHVLTGPVGELEAMSLENFRRLGSTIGEIIERLADKIKVLEHDSFTKKTQGIEAWRRSEIHQLYLQLGIESMQTGQEVSKIIAAREKAGQRTLTLEEFNSIPDLNRRLRF
ncbi:MAG: hypothetical protein C3F02_02665 [Parcubacteria group bacterium]|nr:MAG: hypothetical protein C3F02_02665 [Parcubacteria group bacterium]